MVYAVRPCDVCTRVFQPTHPQQLRCSSACQKAANRRWQRNKKGIASDRIVGALVPCGSCGVAFCRRSSSHRYCDSCQKSIALAQSRKAQGIAPESGLGQPFFCVICGNKAWKTSGGQKYCSVKCRQVAFRRAAHGKCPVKRPLDETFACEICAQETVRIKIGQKYCDEECVKEARRRRQRKRMGSIHFIGEILRCCWCHTPMMRQARAQKYCSPACMKAAQHRHRRAAKAGATLGVLYTRHEIFQRDGWKCQSCGKRVRDNVRRGHPSKSVVDHIIPLSRGGAECESNVQTLCWYCNTVKHNRIGQHDQLRLVLIFTEGHNRERRNASSSTGG